jgi:uncharacterized protein YfkK (UPF0435 family)
MTQEIKEKIEYLNKFVYLISDNQPAHLTSDDINILKEVYRVVLPGKNLNVSCSSCVAYALQVIHSYWVRNTQM